jgi:imidazolonepropionase-like amidohydrolase
MLPVRLSRLVIAALAFALCAAGPAAAQDLAITNARVIVGNGQVINSGTIVVRGGKIVSVGAGTAGTQGLRVIDAKGMSAVPGYIDAHKHVNTGPNEAKEMQALLEAGYTTILSGGGPGDGNITLRDRIEAGTINGPRIIPSERINLRGTPDEARAAIRAMAAKGIRHTGEIALTPLPGPTAEEIAVIRAVVDEGAKAGVQINVHAVSTPAMVAAVEAGVRRLVHLPNKDFTGHDDAKKRHHRAWHRRLRRADLRRVRQRQQSPLPRRQALARSDRRRQPRFRQARAGHRGGVRDAQRANNLG